MYNMLQSLFGCGVYHHDFLEERMHSGNTVRQFHGWRQMPKVARLTEGRIPLGQLTNMLALSEIPCHTSIIGRLAKIWVDSATVKTEMAALPAQIQAAPGVELDRRQDETKGGRGEHLAAGGQGGGNSP